MAEQAGAAGDVLLDLEQLRDNLGGADDATLVEVTAFFVTNVEPLIREAEDYAAGRRSGDLLRVAHAAKGAARNVCAPHLADQLAHLENAAKAADWNAIDRLMPLVSECFRRVAERIVAAGKEDAR
jgi:HPt (histidine-containing phosphotransfer) domain-containing protein